MTASIHVVLNPIAGAGHGRKLRPEIERELAARGLDYRIVETTAPGDAVRIAREFGEAGAAVVAAAGGDGTVHEVANGLLQLPAAGRPALAVLPVGTGNDFIKLLSSGKDRQRAYDLLAGPGRRRFDVGFASWDGGSEYFVNSAGTGIDVEVVRQIDGRRLPGMLGYLLGLFRALVHYRPLPLRVTADGEEQRFDAMIAAVSNGVCIGGGFYVSPAARPDDGHFDVCIVDRLNLRQIASVLPKVIRGAHAGHPRVHMRLARAVELQVMSDRPLFFQLDGELREPPGSRALRIEIRPGELTVVDASPPGTEATGRRHDNAGTVQ
jgi:diacylglycerol kinase (ATP)